MTKLIAEEVKRVDGWYTHSAIKEWMNGREGIPTSELMEFLSSNNMLFHWECADYYDLEDADVSFSQWSDGLSCDGWFIGYIHDGEDGAECLWLKQNAEA